MRRRGRGWAKGVELSVALASLGMAVQAAHGQGGADWAAVEEAIGRKGAPQPGGVMRFSFPRGDLQVTVSRVRLLPALALGSWVAFKETPEGTLAMGDLVLREREVPRVMSALQQAGIEQTALHHHVLHEDPRVLYMHIHAMGDAVEIAAGVRQALALTGTPRASRGAGATPGAVPLDTARIAEILGRAGSVNGGVYQVSVPRAETIREGGVEIPPALGVATAINFQPTGRGRAAIAGDFVMTAAEVNAVIRALRAHGIEVTSVHNHMLAEQPRLFFLHFWANADALALARGLREALDRTNVRR